MANEKWSSFTDVGAPVSGDKIVGLHAGVNVQFDSDSVVGASPTQVQQSAFNVGTDTGVADAYIVDLTPAAIALTEGMIISFNPQNSNTIGGPTLTCNGLSAPIYLPTSQNLLSGDITAGQMCIVSYDASNGNFILVNPLISTVDTTSLIQAGYYFYSNGGPPNAYVVLSNIASTIQPSNGTIIIFNGQTNTIGNPTITIN